MVHHLSLGYGSACATIIEVLSEVTPDARAFATPRVVGALLEVISLDGAAAAYALRKNEGYPYIVTTSVQTTAIKASKMILSEAWGPTKLACRRCSPWSTGASSRWRSPPRPSSRSFKSSARAWSTRRRVLDSTNYGRRACAYSGSLHRAGRAFDEIQCAALACSRDPRRGRRRR